MIRSRSSNGANADFMALIVSHSISPSPMPNASSSACISLDMDTKGNLPAFLTQNRVEYRILMGDMATARAYGGVSTIPTTFFVGKDGIIKNVHIGYLDKDTFEREVRKLL